jgi:hypothetical protein
VTLAAKSAEPVEDQDKAWLGVVLQSSDEPGALIELVHPRGPAKRAGLRRGDIIVQIEGETVTSVEEAIAQIERREPQDAVTVVVLRDGKEEAIKVTLGRASEALSGMPPLAMLPFGWSDGFEELPLGERDWMVDDYAQLKDLVRQLRQELSELRQELHGRPGREAGKKRDGQEQPIKPEKPETRNSSKPDSTESPRASSAADKMPATVSLPAGDFLAQYRPYYRYGVRRYRYYYPGRPYPYSYYYYRGAPYYYAYPPPYAYPYAGPNYYGPGVTVRVGPYVYFRAWR